MIRQVDRLIIKDIAGPWLFGVGLFTALLMAATYLGRLAGFIVDGVPAGIVLELVGLLMPAILVKTFSMSVLLATLLGFGRLSSDSEIVAIRAAGASIYRIVAPVAFFSVLVAIGTFWFNENVAPRATKEYQRIADSVIKTTKVKARFPVAKPIVHEGKLRLFICAENVNPASQALQGVTMLVYDDKEKLSLIMFAKQLLFKSESDWTAVGNVRILPADFSKVVSIADKVWPSQIPRPGQTFKELTTSQDDDPDSMTMGELRSSIIFHMVQQDVTPDTVRNYEYWYWGKIAIPLAAVSFGILGAVLGIRNHRAGTATGFALAVAIIFAYLTLANFMNVWAEGGVIPAWLAAFSPLVIGGVVSGVIMWRRNQ